MILCVEDELNIQELIVYTLNSTGYTAKGASSFLQMKELMSQELPELILLDIMLPDESGLNILKKLKEDVQTRLIPVIILTAKSSEMDKIIGLDSGADDYITKPFSMLELISRIKAVLRRSQKDASSILTFRDLTMDLARHTVSVGTQKIALTLKEFELLRKLLENQGTVCTRDMLLDEIWGYDYYGESRTVDVHIRTLRSKLGKAELYIETIRGVGYKLID